MTQDEKRIMKTALGATMLLALVSIVAGYMLAAYGEYILAPATVTIIEVTATPIGTALPPPTATSQPTLPPVQTTIVRKRNGKATRPPQPTVRSTGTPIIICRCWSNIYNCADFSTHNQAQACYKYCISQGRGDIHHLDGDNDGIACESLP